MKIFQNTVFGPFWGIFGQNNNFDRRNEAAAPFKTLPGPKLVTYMQFKKPPKSFCKLKISQISFWSYRPKPQNMGFKMGVRGNEGGANFSPFAAPRTA